jgi:transcriptional regulator with XRE-family HTH domain
MTKHKPNKKLRKARRDSDLTIKALAEKLDVSIQTVLNYERGKCNPSPERFTKLKKALKLTGKFTDWFEPRTVRKYGPNDKCKRRGCNKPPKSKGYCMTHYIAEWRREQREAAKKAEAKKAEAKKAKPKAQVIKFPTKGKKVQRKAAKTDIKPKSKKRSTKGKGRKSKK